MATLLGYAFTGSVLTPTSTIANVTGSAITKSTTLNTFVVQTALGYATQPVLQTASGSTTYAAAITSGNYITFDLTVAAGFQVSITGLSLAGARGGASTPRGIGIRSSADGYAADLMPDTPLTTVRPTFVTYTASPTLSNLTGTVTLRIYVYSQSATVELDDITVTGVVSAIAVPTVLAGGLVEADVLAVTLVSVDAAVPTALAGGTAETDTLNVALISATAITATVVETDTVAVALGTSTTLSVALVETDVLAGALATAIALSAALLEGDTVGGALATGTQLAAALLETDTVAVTLVMSTGLAGQLLDVDTVTATLGTSTRLAAALTETDLLGGVLGTTTALAGALLELDTIGAALRSPMLLTAALTEADLLVGALSTPGAPATLAVVPSFGTIPFTVTATATASADAGQTLSYAFVWGDGATTAAQPAATVTHQYVSSGIYDVAVTVGRSATAVPLTGGLAETDTLTAVLVSAATAPAIAFGWQLTPTTTGLSGAGIDRTTLPTYSGGIPVAGQTITLQKITSSWDLAGWNGGSNNGPQIANVTFDRCWFSVPLDRCGQFGPNNLLVDCDIVGPSTSPNAYGPLVSGGVTTPAIFRRCFLDNFTIGLWLDGAATVDGCYLTSLTVDPNAHVDGITRRGSTLPLSIVRSYIRAKGSSVTGALFVTADFALNPSGVSVSDSLFESDGVDCLHIGNNNTGGTSSYAFSNCRAIGSTIVDRSGLGTCVSNPFTMWMYDTNNAFNSTDGGRKGASVPF